MSIAESLSAAVKDHTGGNVLRGEFVVDPGLTSTYGVRALVVDGDIPRIVDLVVAFRDHGRIVKEYEFSAWPPRSRGVPVAVSGQLVGGV